MDPDDGRLLFPLEPETHSPSIVGFVCLLPSCIERRSPPPEGSSRPFACALGDRLSFDFRILFDDLLYEILITISMFRLPVPSLTACQPTRGTLGV